jgi:peptidyl-prolyl isomerase D
VFGELVSGWHVAEAINALSRGKKNSTAGKEEEAKIVDSGQIRKGSLVPDLKKP